MALTSTSNFSDHQTRVILHMADWRAEAKCKSINTELFYDTEESVMKKQAAKYCVTCPVQNQCLYTAVVISERHGVWGGLTPKQRKALIRNLKLIARSKELDLDTWNKDVDNLIFQHTNLQAAYNIINN
jgi:hypothetical protein